jgi:hypothetical protein
MSDSLRFEELFDPERQPAVPGSGPLTAADIGEVLRENLAPGETLDIFSLPRVRVPTGGATVWELPDGRSAEAITGVIIHRQTVRAFWSTPFSGGGVPPECYSPDAITGIGIPGGNCRTCPYARWGSAVGPDGKPRAGQACRLITRLFILTEGAVLPWFLPLPPSSYKTAFQYIVSLTTSGQRYWHVVTELRLQRTKNRDGLYYSQVIFRNAGQLDEKQATWVDGYRAALVPALQGMPVTAEEAEDVEGSA